MPESTARKSSTARGGLAALGLGALAVGCWRRATTDRRIGRRRRPRHAARRRCGGPRRRPGRRRDRDQDPHSQAWVRARTGPRSPRTQPALTPGPALLSAGRFASIATRLLPHAATAQRERREIRSRSWQRVRAGSERSMPVACEDDAADRRDQQHDHGNQRLRMQEVLEMPTARCRRTPAGRRPPPSLARTFAGGWRQVRRRS